MKRLSVLSLFLVQIWTVVAAASSSSFHTATAFHRQSGSATRVPLTLLSRYHGSSAFEATELSSKSEEILLSIRGGETAASDNDDAAEPKKKKKKKSKSASKAHKKPSTTTKKHLDGKLKSTNPNYRIQKELKSFIQEPPPNLSVQVGPNIRAWVVTMVGANNTIYDGEVFKLRINFPKDYPTVPPSVYFLKGHIPTHEHVYTNGDICLSLLGKDWRPTMTAQSIAVSILSILSSAQHKKIPMDNANHASAKPGEYQKDWVYHDDNC